MTSTEYNIISWVLLAPATLTVLVFFGYAVFVTLKDKEYGLVSLILFILVTTILANVFHELYKQKAAEEKAAQIEEVEK